MEQTDAETRNATDVLRLARSEEEWAIWHPGDGTQYRVKVIPVVGGPDHADRILLIVLGGRTTAIQYADPAIAAYRVKTWTAGRWKAEKLNPPGGYDWWPQVVKPLLRAAGVA